MADRKGRAVAVRGSWREGEREGEREGPRASEVAIFAWAHFRSALPPLPRFHVTPSVAAAFAVPLASVGTPKISTFLPV